MRKIVNERYQETYYEETLNNGLHVILWHKPDYEKSLFMMATPLGATDLKQIDENQNIYTFPAGIAHFLEHKMFEVEQGDVMDMFSNLGANVNAFTSYTETAYYFSTSTDFVKPLHLLLDFVQDLHISEQSVEKEKGIIIQELNMYKQMSDQRLLMEVFTSLFQKHPLRFDIGGDSESVSNTTLQQLEECYHINYHPSTMVLVGVSGEDPKRIMEEIKRNQDAKTFTHAKKISTVIWEEPKEVARKEYTFYMDVSVPKVCVVYKLEGEKDPYERLKREWCIKIMLDTHFSTLNKDFQTWLDEGILSDYAGCEIDLGEDYGFLLFFCETSKIEAFEEIVAHVMENIKAAQIETTTLSQLKKRYFSQAIRSLNSFDDIAISCVRNYFQKVDYFKAIEVLENITKEQIQETCTALNLDAKAHVYLKPDKKM